MDVPHESVLRVAKGCVWDFIGVILINSALGTPICKDPFDGICGSPSKNLDSYVGALTFQGVVAHQWISACKIGSVTTLLS